MKVKLNHEHKSIFQTLKKNMIKLDITTNVSYPMLPKVEKIRRYNLMLETNHIDVNLLN